MDELTTQSRSMPSHYRVIRTVDIAGDEEFLVIPLLNYAELDELADDEPYWDDSPLGWDAADFANPDIYVSVEQLYIAF